MTVIEIPTRNDILAYQYKVLLDNTYYVLRFTYNKRIERWLLDIMDTDEVVLKGGILLVSGFNLIGRYKDVTLPKGVLFTIDLKGGNTTATMDTFGINVALLYGEAE